MSIPVIATVDFGGPAEASLLVLGPSLGTSVSALWSAAAAQLTDRHRVIGWDLPGHGVSPAPKASFSIADLADAVHDAAVAHGATRYHYAGVSVAGAVGVELLLRHGHALRTVALICTGAKIRTQIAWIERARTVRARGTSVMIGPAVGGWFADGFTRHNPDTVAALLQSLAEADAEGYAATCEALACFDVRDQLGAITGNVLTVAGAEDTATPPAALRQLAEHIPGCRYLELAATAHLAPAEQPVRVAAELAALIQRSHS